MKRLKTSSILWGIAALLTLGGCAAPGPKFSGLKNVPPGQAEIIVYRKEALFAAGQTMPLSIDGIEIGELYNASFLQQSVTPGKHDLRISTGPLSKSAETSIQIAAGERKYLHFDFPTGPLANVFFIGVSLEERDGRIALDDLKELSSARSGRTEK